MSESWRSVNTRKKIRGAQRTVLVIEILTHFAQKKQNSIVRKLLDPSAIKIVNTFDYVFTRWKQMKIGNVHTYGIQDQNLAKMVLNNI